MRILKWFISLIALINGSASLQAQEIPEVIWDQVESYVQNLEDEQIDLTMLYDELEILFDSQLDINRASYEDLQELRLLTEVQINGMLDHRAAYGDFLQVEELLTIPSFSVEDVILVRYFMKVADKNKLPISVSRMFAESRHEVFLKWGQTLENKAGYKANDDDGPAYLGDKNKLFLRLRSNYENKLRYGFTIEKDEGEQLISDTIYRGLDYVTAHLYLKDYSTLLKDFAVGDYSISMGQGLIVHSGFGAGKSVTVGDIKKGGRNIRPYNSVTENGYHRGLAATLRPYKNVELTLMGSSVNRDGNLRIDTLNNDTPDLFFSSLQTSGTHRTLAEKEDKDIVSMTTLGGILKYTDHRFSVALNHLYNRLDQPIIRADAAYNLFRFNGSTLSNTSIDYSYRIKNLHMFGESARDSGGGMAHMLGALVGLNRRMSLSMHYRNYGKDYNALTPSAFGEGSLVNNEKGFFMGMELRINRNWNLRCYADVWQHPWLRSRVANPSDGKEYLARLDYYVRRKVSAYVQYFYEQKYENETYDDPVLSLSRGSKLTVGQLQTRHKIRIQFNNIISRDLELRNRVEYSRFDDINGTSDGYMLYQDVIYKPFASPLSLTARFALFDTDNNDSRIYAFENNILYEFGIPSYSGRGYRYYINLRRKFGKHLTAELRWAKTYKNRGNNGSGRELIDEDTRTDVKAQLKFAF